VHRVALQDSPHVYFVKLRPGLAGFFERLSELFELHVYTMGSRSYAHAVVRLFDPDGRLFQDRVLSRDDNEVIENRKMLTRIFPTDDRMVVVIDDRADVWAGCLNLLQVHPYVFFIGTGDINNPFLRSSANLTIDAPEAELDNEAGVLQARIDQIINTLDAELVTIERVLKGIHGQFYSKYVVDSEELPDVKEILPRLKSQIMAGCRFVFSGVFSRHQPVEE
jgi:RNA polymerase II subunit A-like phosphatase